jgi:hypothetical protein
VDAQSEKLNEALLLLDYYWKKKKAEKERGN